MRFVELMTALCLLAGVAAAQAAPTAVDVHVLSRDAKFVGSSVGGARVTIEDAETGEVLAQGVTDGSTGDTDLIMGERKHGVSLITPGTAVFSASLELPAPKKVRVTAFGPLDYLQSANTVSTTQWLLPGSTAGEQGWILELPGLIVDVHDTPAVNKLENGTVSVPVNATVRMMCGCPLTPDGMWDSNEFDIEARVLSNDVEIASTPLEYAGTTSEFRGELQLTQAGAYVLRVRAHQSRTGNTGVVDRPLVVH